MDHGDPLVGERAGRPRGNVAPHAPPGKAHANASGVRDPAKEPPQALSDPTR